MEEDLTVYQDVISHLKEASNLAKNMQDSTQLAIIKTLERVMIEEDETKSKKIKKNVHYVLKKNGRADDLKNFVVLAQSENDILVSVFWKDGGHNILGFNLATGLFTYLYSENVIGRIMCGVLGEDE